MNEYMRVWLCLHRAQVICHFGDHLANELLSCLPIYLDRLRNEITRLTTVKALTLIANSRLKIDLRIILVSQPFKVNTVRS